MQKKEFKDVLKQTLFLVLLTVLFIIILKLVVLFTGMEHKSEDYAPIFYQIFALFFSFFHGISLFSTEQRNNGFEYMLTLPYSRSKLLLLKIAPRLAAVLGLYLIYVLISIFSNINPFLVSPVSSLSLYIALFFISTSLSVLRGNYVANSLITGMMFVLFLAAANLPLWLIIRKYYGIGEVFKLRIFAVGETYPFSPFSIALLGLLISIPFIISLFYGFKKYDVRSSGRYLKRFFTMLFPLVLAGMAISYAMLNLSIGEPEAHHYITKKGVILKYDFRGTNVISGKGGGKLPDFYPHRKNFYEKDGFVFLSIWDWTDNPNGNIVRFDDQFKESKNIYSPTGRKFLSRTVYGYEYTLAFLESSGKKYSWNRSTDNQIVFLNIDTGNTIKYKFPFDDLTLIGVSVEDGSRIWIGYFIEHQGVTVYTINSQGEIKRILRSKDRPHFIDNQLISFDKGGIVFGKFAGAAYRKINSVEIKERLLLPLFLHTSDLNEKKLTSINAKAKHPVNYDVYAEKDPLEFLNIDLSTHQLTRFKEDSIKRGFLHAISSGEQFLLKFNDNGQLKVEGIYKLEKTVFKLLKDFRGKGEFQRGYWGFAGNGYVIGKGEEAKFYLFPDLKELKY